MKLRLLPALLLAGSTLIAAPAFAQDFDSECIVDADCPTDYTCQEIGAYSCASPPPCPEGDTECEMERAEEPPCESGVIMGCVAPPPEQCDPDAGASACDAGLTCLTYTYEQCSGGGAIEPVMCTVDPDGNSDCEEPPPAEEPVCTTESESYCVPDYFAPCQIDADCGDGFKCVDEPAQCDVYCTGAVPPCPEGESCPEPDVEPCMETCDEPSGAKYCELQQVECSSDADCTGDLICVDLSDYISPSVNCTEPAERGDGGTDDPGAPDMDGDGEDDEPHCEPEPATPQNYCLPQNWERWIGDEGYGAGGGVSYDDAVADATGRESDGENGSGSWELVDKQAPQAPSQDDDAEGTPVAEQTGGCQSAPGSSPAGGLGLLAALGMMLGLRRRKQ